jgi:hypothetical protein
MMIFCGITFFILLVSCDRTTYSSGFNRFEFNKIKLGDSIKSVKIRIGEPLSKNKFPAVHGESKYLIEFRYSGCKANCDYTRFSIIFDEDTVIVKSEAFIGE